MGFRLFRHFSRLQFVLLSIVSFLVLLDILSHQGARSPKTIKQTKEVLIDFDEPLEDIPETFSKSLNRRQSNNSAIKFRKISPQDIPPETRSDWIKPENEIPVRRFPKCLLVGFSKCGTSSLLTFLNFHPDIVSLDWETDYFCDRVYFKYSLHWYRMRMPLSTSNQITLEKSPCYISERQALERIQAFNKSMKIMVILRDPITRIISQHGQYLASFKAMGQRQLTIEDRYINQKTGQLLEAPIKKWGIFTSRVENLLSVFPREQIHIIDGDRFIKNPLRVLADIETFLGVQKYFSEKDVYFDPLKGFFCPRNRSNKKVECMGYQKGRRHTEMSPKVRHALLHHLRPYTERLFDLIGYRMQWDLGIQHAMGTWNK